MTERDMASEAPVVPSAWVAHHLDDEDVVLVEVDEEAGTYYDGHVQGARKLDWVDDLAHPTRRAFVDQPSYESLLERLGITQDSHVVLYGDAGNVHAAYAYWILRYYDHPRVSLMDGGRRLWAAEGRPLSTDVPEVSLEHRYRVRRTRHEFRASRDQVLHEFVGAPTGTAVIDCRETSEFAGRVANSLDLPLARHRVPGRIPGARHFSSAELLDAGTGRLRSRSALRAGYRERGVGDGTSVLVYCRLAERSALHWLVLHDVLGHPDVRNYDGGWAEYGSLVDAPVHRDDLPAAEA